MTASGIGFAHFPAISRELNLSRLASFALLSLLSKEKSCPTESADQSRPGGVIEVKQLEAVDMGIFKTGCAFAIGLSLLASTSLAQETSTNQVAAKTDWSVFVESDPTECWGVSAPKESVFTREGRVVAATRDPALLMVFYRPSAGASGQVAFTGGYPFRNGSTVTVDISGAEYSLFTDGEWAWPASEADDAKIVTAMKRGATAVVTGVSSRGTTTKDTFSLLGFTAAVEDAEARCRQ